MNHPALVEVLPPIKTGTHHLAFPVYIGIPHGCALYALPDERMAPHVARRKSVVVDCTDRVVQFGEFYLMQQFHGPAVWQFMKPLRQNPLAERPTTVLRVASNEAAGFGYLSDGEVYLDAIADKIIGRVIGVYGG